MYCKACGVEMNDNQAICIECGVKAGDGDKFCANCGTPLNPDAAVCLNCGVAAKPSNDINGQDKTMLAVICILIGGFGIHNFILGETKKGIMKIVLTCCCGIGYILAIVDFIRILTDSYVVDPEKLF